VGFSCWALGYVDPDRRLVGCMLHPAQNHGVDLRYRVDYGDKCRREMCPEARIFLDLDAPARKFFLQLAQGMDSFAYSSRRTNPLFHLLGWGMELLRRIAAEEDGQRFTRQRFFQTYPFLRTCRAPKAVAYLVAGVVRHRDLAPLREEAFPIRFMEFSSGLARTLKNSSMGNSAATPTHRLSLDAQFLDFVRLFLDMNYMSAEGATCLKEMTDEALERFCESL
jgi:hypothetical protein